MVSFRCRPFSPYVRDSFGSRGEEEHQTEEKKKEKRKEKKEEEKEKKNEKKEEKKRTRSASQTGVVDSQRIDTRPGSQLLQVGTAHAAS